MTPHDFLTRLAADKEKAIYRINPLVIRTTEKDVQAARLILWMQEVWPELTIGHTLDILSNAVWWVTTWVAIMKGQESNEIEDVSTQE